MYAFGESGKRLQIPGLTIRVPQGTTINITLHSDLVEWQTVAKDAADVFNPALPQADQMIAIGEAYDFAYRATSPEVLTLEGLSPNNGRRVVQTLIFSDPEQ